MIYFYEGKKLRRYSKVLRSLTGRYLGSLVYLRSRLTFVRVSLARLLLPRVTLNEQTVVGQLVGHTDQVEGASRQHTHPYI